MRHPFRKLLTCTLLATYASIALLGQGLHWLTPDDGHHHHGLSVVSCTTHDHDYAYHGDCCHHHHADDNIASGGKAIVTSSCDTDCHTCEICEFLIQAVSQPPQIVATPDLHVLVADLPCESQGLYSPTIVGLHAARGPPQRGA